MTPKGVVDMTRSVLILLALLNIFVNLVLKVEAEFDNPMGNLGILEPVSEDHAATIPSVAHVGRLATSCGVVLSLTSRVAVVMVLVRTP